VQLTRNRIIAAAMDLIERDGVEAVSMHRLATELGCGIVSLYNYVPSKSALLDGIAEVLMAGIEVPSVRSASGWQAQIQAQARAFREMARTRPRCTMVVLSRPAASAGIMRHVERALATLQDASFGGQDAVRIVRVLVSYIAGCLLTEVGVAPGLDTDGAEVHRPRLRPGEFPHLTALAAETRVSNPDADFEFGLDLVIRSVVAVQPMRAVAS
jgi:AcrR family transcriptional regulator